MKVNVGEVWKVKFKSFGREFLYLVVDKDGGTVEFFNVNDGKIVVWQNFRNSSGQNTNGLYDWELLA